jgi:hypothetical protein
MHASDQMEYEVRYVSLFDSGRAYAFPCDATGCVDLENLSQRARDSYLSVQRRVGREFATPEVMRTTLVS